MRKKKNNSFQEYFVLLKKKIENIPLENNNKQIKYSKKFNNTETRIKLQKNNNQSKIVI